MSPFKLTAALALAAASVAILPPSASADSLIASAPGARNLAAGGGWYAWAAPTANGRWRLAVRNPSTGVVSLPAIPDFGAPPDPAIGSDVVGGELTDRRLVVAYARCDGSSTISGCDVWAYDIARGSERRVTGLSSSSVSETAPSVDLGSWSYVRRGSGVARRGVYVRTRGDRVHRISTVLARETASNGSRAAYAYASSAGGGVALRRASGDGGVEVLTSRRSATPRSLVTTRYQAAWLEGANAFRTTRFAGSGGPFSPVVVTQARWLSDTVDSLVTDGSQVRTYLDAAGIKSISPPLF